MVPTEKFIRFNYKIFLINSIGQFFHNCPTNIYECFSPFQTIGVYDKTIIKRRYVEIFKLSEASLKRDDPSIISLTFWCNKIYMYIRAIFFFEYFFFFGPHPKFCWIFRKNNSLKVTALNINFKYFPWAWKDFPYKIHVKYDAFSVFFYNPVVLYTIISYLVAIYSKSNNLQKCPLCRKCNSYWWVGTGHWSWFSAKIRIFWLFCFGDSNQLDDKKKVNRKFVGNSISYKNSPIELIA